MYKRYFLVPTVVDYSFRIFTLLSLINFHVPIICSKILFTAKLSAHLPPTFCCLILLKSFKLILLTFLILVAFRLLHAVHFKVRSTELYARLKCIRKKHVQDQILFITIILDLLHHIYFIDWEWEPGCSKSFLRVILT